MVTGLQIFRDHFRNYSDSFVVIGGVACDAWFASQGLDFRATQDVDMVLLVEGRRPEFLKHFWGFIDAHGYDASSRKDGTRTYYRFVKPGSKDVPAMIELFSAMEIDDCLTEGQRIMPVASEENVPSLSAILMDPDYYNLIRDAAEPQDGLPVVGPVALIPLKARAYLDLVARKDKGETVPSRDIKKHRNDAFQLTATLPDTLGQALPDAIKTDLAAFLERFPEDSADWEAIRASARTSLGTAVPTPAELRSALKTYFGL